MFLEKLISGGQTGVDRGALDAALAAGFACGGWCPEGRLSEDGPIPEQYPVAELVRGDYRARTRRNVLDSDGTLIVCPGEPGGGTLETLRDCLRFGKPHLVIEASETDPATAAARAAVFVVERKLRVLNVAGPRASGWPGGAAYAKAVVELLLRNVA